MHSRNRGRRRRRGVNTLRAQGRTCWVASTPVPTGSLTRYDPGWRGGREGQSVIVRWLSRSAVGDQVLIFAGGGMRSSTTSSEAIGQAARFDGFPDD